jgi:molecular chaperone GrpE
MGNNKKKGSSMRSSGAMVEDTMVAGVEDGEKQEGAAGQVSDSQAGAAQTTEAGGEGSGATAALKTELEQLRGERDLLLDRLARLQAEFDNARKRESKERQDTRDYAVQGAVQPFLGVMDNFQLALKSQGSLEQLRGGVELILKQMEEALRGLNVQPVESVGAIFDPKVHEALGSVETAEFPDHQVLEEVRRGYKIREKLLRPALVKIASNSAMVSG